MENNNPTPEKNTAPSPDQSPANVQPEAGNRLTCGQIFLLVIGIVITAVDGLSFLLYLIGCLMGSVDNLFIMVEVGVILFCFSLIGILLVYLATNRKKIDAIKTELTKEASAGQKRTSGKLAGASMIAAVVALAVAIAVTFFTKDSVSITKYIIMLPALPSYGALLSNPKSGRAWLSLLVTLLCMFVFAVVSRMIIVG